MKEHLLTVEGNFTSASTSGPLTTPPVVSSSSIEVGGTKSSMAATSESSLASGESLVKVAATTEKVKTAVQE